MQSVKHYSIFLMQLNRLMEKYGVWRMSTLKPPLAGGMCLLGDAVRITRNTVPPL